MGERILFNTLRVKELKKLLEERKITYDDCLEKKDFIEKLLDPAYMPSNETKKTAPELKLQANKLPDWPHLGQTLGQGDADARSFLAHAFDKCAPVFTRMNLALGQTQTLTPPVQWVYSMFHVAESIAAMKMALPLKFSLQDEAQTQALICEVTAIKTCPSALPQNNLENTELKSNPILFVQYLLGSRANLSVSLPYVETFYQEAESTQRPISQTTAESAEEVLFAGELLKRNERYVAQTQIRPGFRNSVIFPPCPDDLIIKHKKTKRTCVVCGSRHQLKSCSGGL